MMAHTDADNRAYYDDFSQGYEREREAGYHRLLDDLEVKVASGLAHNRRVLEVGCGTGLILSRLAPTARFACGLDVSPKMLQRAKSRALPVVLGSATRLPFADNTFDLVCSFKVLAHVADIEVALREIARVTRPGGFMALEFYNRWSLRYLVKRLSGPGAISAQRTEADVFTRWDTPRTIAHMLPADVELKRFYGVRVLTPAAFVHKLPVVGRGLAHAERYALASPLGRFGGFLIALAQKRDEGSAVRH